MTDQLMTSIVTIATGLIGVAIIATLVSKNAQTATVIQSGGSAFSQSLATALSPVTGSSGLGSFSGMGASIPNSNL